LELEEREMEKRGTKEKRTTKMGKGKQIQMTPSFARRSPGEIAPELRLAKRLKSLIIKESNVLYSEVKSAEECYKALKNDKRNDLELAEIHFHSGEIPNIIFRRIMIMTNSMLDISYE
jgi:hypothetical protein